jgi:predicted acyl esterase
LVAAIRGLLGREPVPWRWLSEDLGATALRRHPHLQAPGPAADAAHDLLAPGRVGRPHGPKAHDCTIRTERVDDMWGTDLTSTMTGESQTSIFVTVDYASTECIGIPAARRATRFEALEPLRQGVRTAFGGFAGGIADSLKLRDDHGSQFVADDHQRELAFLGISGSPAFVREFEGDGCVERFIRTLKENLLWVRRFDTIEELRLALHRFKETYNHTWIIQRHGSRPRRRSERRSLRRSRPPHESATRCRTTMASYTSKPLYGAGTRAASKSLPGCTMSVRLFLCSLILAAAQVHETIAAQDLVTRVPMRDAVRLETFVYLPVDQPRIAVPTILLRTPYLFPGKGATYYERFARAFTDRGYAFVLQNVRGRFGSEGVFEPFANEVSDGSDTVAWITAQAWSNGRIGTVGGSYNGFTALAAAVGSDSVKAVVADDPPLDLSSGHRGGALSLLPAFWLYLLEKGEWPKTADKQAASNAPDPATIDNLLLGRDAAFWRDYLAWPAGLGAATLRGRIPEICAPVLVIKSRSEGWEDPADLWRTLRDGSCPEHRDAHRLVVTAQGHAHHIGLIGVSETDVNRRMIDWLDYWLGDDADTGNAVFEASVLFRPTENDPFRQSETWPVPGRERALYLQNPWGVADNAPLRGRPASRARSDRLEIDPVTMDPCSNYPRQTYLSYPLEKGILLAGNIRLELFVSASTPSMELSALVYDYDVARETPLSFVTFGVARIDLVGEEMPRPVTIEMHSLSHQFAAGSRIALAISGSPCGYVEAGNGPTRNDPPRPSVYRLFHGGAFPSRLIIEDVLEGAP